MKKLRRKFRGWATSQKKVVEHAAPDSEQIGHAFATFDAAFDRVKQFVIDKLTVPVTDADRRKRAAFWQSIHRLATHRALLRSLPYSQMDVESSEREKRDDD